MEKGIVKPTYVGTPQGGNLSPLLSNIMLNELDKELGNHLHFERETENYSHGKSFHQKMHHLRFL